MKATCPPPRGDRRKVARAAPHPLAILVFSSDPPPLIHKLFFFEAILFSPSSPSIAQGVIAFMTPVPFFLSSWLPFAFHMVPVAFHNPRWRACLSLSRWLCLPFWELLRMARFEACPYAADAAAPLKRNAPPCIFPRDSFYPRSWLATAYTLGGASLLARCCDKACPVTLRPHSCA